ncbi:unnamed protein product, partial [marine sediment metagenome]
DEETLDTTTRTGTANYEINEELWNRIFNIETGLDEVKRETEAEINRALDEVSTFSERFYNRVTFDLDQMREDAQKLLVPMASLMAEGLMTMIPAAISSLFSEFMDAFFEDA